VAEAGGGQRELFGEAVRPRAGGTAHQELFDDLGRSRGYYSADNRLNDLTGREWLYWTRSVINRPYPANCQHALRRTHGGQKPPDLCADLIRVFSKRGQRVLDPFMGVGGVLLGAAQAERAAVGVEINPRWIEIYQEVCRREGIPELATRVGDAGTVLEQVAGPFDLVFTDVPYWNMDVARRSKGSYKRVGERARPAPSTRLGEFGSASGYPDKATWLAAMERVFRLAVDRLKSGGYLLSFIGDMYAAGAYHALSAELAGVLSSIEPLSWQANLIWYDVSKKLHIYGYRYRYIPSLVHQNVLVFRKQEPGAAAARS
jgi:DNA modification methylase